MRERRIWRSLGCPYPCAVLPILSFDGTGMTAYGTSKKIFLVTQAKPMALTGDSGYKKKYNETPLKQIKYRDAVRSTEEKKQNLTTFC